MSTADELRAVARRLRTCPASLADFIPLLQRAADELEALHPNQCEICGAGLPCNCHEPAGVP